MDTSPAGSHQNPSQGGEGGAVQLAEVAGDRAEQVALSPLTIPDGGLVMLDVVTAWTPLRGAGPG